MSARCKPGQQVELGRYEIEAGTRVLVGRRIDGVVHVYDFAVDRPSRAYFVEAGFETCAELAALVADYRALAERIDACPMGPGGLDEIVNGPKQAVETSRLQRPIPNDNPRQQRKELVAR
jgi:hypothetical protein